MIAVYLWVAFTIIMVVWLAYDAMRARVEIAFLEDSLDRQNQKNMHVFYIPSSDEICMVKKIKGTDYFKKTLDNDYYVYLGPL